MRVDFKKTKSKNFPEALELARNADVCHESTSANAYIATFSPENWHRFIRLASLVKSWAGTYLLHNGVEITYKDCQWLKAVRDCYAKRIEYEAPEVYCTIGPGYNRQKLPCYQLDINDLDMKGFDIDEATHIVERRAHERWIHLCPAFAWEEVKSIIRKNYNNEEESSHPAGLLVSGRADS